MIERPNSSRTLRHWETVYDGHLICVENELFRERLIIDGTGGMNMSRFTAGILALALLLSPMQSGAQSAAPAYRASLTISPFHLLSPQLQVTGEARLASRLGASATVGGGNVTDDDRTYAIWEIGGQLRYYAVGVFSRGLMVGADIGYIDLPATPSGAMEMLAGARAGGFVGYKHTMGTEIGRAHV